MKIRKPGMLRLLAHPPQLKVFMIDQLTDRVGAIDAGDAYTSKKTQNGFLVINTGVDLVIKDRNAVVTDK